MHPWRDCHRLLAFSFARDICVVGPRPAKAISLYQPVTVYITCHTSFSSYRTWLDGALPDEVAIVLL